MEYIMSFQLPITIAKAINEIEKNQYLLPAIQREFVWSSDKIEWLFDSLMKGYPISSFLFWKVEKNTAKKYKFYKFISEYRERYKIHNDEISTNGMDSFFAILDGQQRLTSLYIGLKGSYAYKEYRKKWEDSEISIPTKYLYLNISKKLENEEDGREYNFKFINKADTGNEKIYTDSNNEQWFKVGEILNYQDDVEFDDFVDSIDNKNSKKILRCLRNVIINKGLINYFLEEEQDLNKALNIFIRVNSGGEPLNFSDLIMSIAIANWEKEDARKEIHHLVDLIREKGFYISKDFVLKTFLFLHSKDIKFKVTNFSRENAKDFEKNWEKIRYFIIETFDLLKTFGFNDYTLTSKNSVIPIIYYLYYQEFKDFSSKVKFKRDREIIKKWLHTVLLKQLFGSSSDTTLSQIRQTFTDDVTKNPLRENFLTFPTEFKKVKDFNVDEEFIEDLLSIQKDDKYAFSILSLLYPHLDYKNNDFHKDHIHPENKYSKLSKLDKENYGWEVYNSIYNLQLLDQNENMSKKDMDLEEWVSSKTQKRTRKQFLEQHIIPDVDLSIKNFSEFFEERKKLLINKLYELLN